jgi:hypothetical protein
MSISVKDQGRTQKASGLRVPATTDKALVKTATMLSVQATQARPLWPLVVVSLMMMVIAAKTGAAVI